jgi:hypothetical protein
MRHIRGYDPWLWVFVAGNGSVIMGLAFLLATYRIVSHNIGNAAPRLIVPTPLPTPDTHTHTIEKFKLLQSN